GGVAGALLSQRLDLTLAETLSGFSGTLWGAWVGAWLGIAYGEELNLEVSGLSAAGSDVGLLLSSLAISNIGEMPPARVGYINVFGVGGALAGAAIGLFIEPFGATQADRAVKGTLYGTTLALVVGTIITGIADLGTEVVEEEVKPETQIKSSWRIPGWLPDIEVAIPMIGPVPPRNPEEPVTDPGIFVGVQGLF
ncbi:MAG: hypothetical protein V3T05_03155, partial [Myxococcota bacterium]